MAHDTTSPAGGAKTRKLRRPAKPRPRAQAVPPTVSVEEKACPNARLGRRMDSAIHAAQAMATGGVSYWAALQAWEDWAYHMALSPGRAAGLALEAAAAGGKVATHAARADSGRATEGPFAPQPGDRRFRDTGWSRAPFDAYAQAQLAMDHIWRQATEPMDGVSAHHMRRVRFMGEHVLQAIAPPNFPWSNPRAVETVLQSGGMCLMRGWRNYADDMAALWSGRPMFETDAFAVGRNMAVAPGQVVLRNDLMELIQYAPSTPDVRREPVLIVPAWIMKYYVLDLSAEMSLISHLVDQGFTVFCISWRNPGRESRQLGLDDYRKHGVMAALDAIEAIVPGEQVHATGYCLGGTILSIAAAVMGREGDNRLASLSLLAAQADFSEAGELTMFIDESQVAVLEDLMSVNGYLDARQMAGAFNVLRANEMLWSRVAERYFTGEKRTPTELDAWLTDATRMPERMHSQYLRWLFLENRFSQGNLIVDGAAAVMKDIIPPIFVVGAELDHIAPWRSVHKIGLFAGSDTTFVLSGGGHNTAIVSPPGKPRAHYRVHRIGSCNDYVDPDRWLPKAEKKPGSWWPEWAAWLDDHSTPGRVQPPAMGAKSKGYAPIAPAPGSYVLER